jgi:hypothetical protein
VHYRVHSRQMLCIGGSQIPFGWSFLSIAKVPMQWSEGDVWTTEASRLSLAGAPTVADCTMLHIAQRKQNRCLAADLYTPYTTLSCCRWTCQRALGLSISMSLWRSRWVGLRPAVSFHDDHL